MKNKYRDGTFIRVPEKFEIPGSRKPGEKRRIVCGEVHIDYGCFKKTAEEKFRLKMAKRKLQ